MRILWICNLVLPEFSNEFNIKPTCYGGWMSGMLHQLEQVDNLTVGLCFPIIDEERMKRGVCNNHSFYSFHAFMDKGEYQENASKEFLEILADFKPNVIHIWGTEYNHAKAVMDAGENLGLKSKVLIHIQGLLSFCAVHYTLGVEIPFLADILNEKEDFVRRGKVEHSVLKHVEHVAGRTEWDRSCSLLVNKNVQYHICNEILRSEFYEEKGTWSFENCRKHRIFISQASYSIKGFHFLLNAVKIIKEQIDDVEVYVGGYSNIMDLPYGLYIKSLIDSFDIKRHIHFLGNLTAQEMIDQFLQAQVFVCPSTIENSSNSICEAMLLGVPVVASYVGGTPSLIRHGEDGFLYPCDAHYMLAYYIMQIFRDDELAKRISRAARETARERHNPEKIRNRMIEIYREVAAS